MKTAKQIEERVRERLDCVHHEPAWEDITVHVAWGVPADEITKLATGLAANLIVIGKKPQRGLVRLLLGSTADEVVRRAPCPVLVAHAPGPSVPTVTQKVA
jgi:nucleotide-binding universal stress UspA family protein